MNARNGSLSAASLYRKAAAWIEEGDELIAEFERAGLAAPTPLLHLHATGAGTLPSGPASVVGALVVKRPEPPAPRPASLLSDAMWIPLAAAAVKSVVLAVLDNTGKRLDAGLLLDTVQRTRQVAVGTIFNALSTLASGGYIERQGDEWVLLKPNSAPVLSGEYLWGPQENFNAHELAWFRRAVVVQLLRDHPDGLRIMEIAGALEPCKWAPDPKDKNSIKADLLALKSEGVYPLQDDSRRWAIKPTARKGVS